jgi:hypothetical protein
MRALGKNYKDAEASTGDFEKLPAGGYICRIITADDCPVGFNRNAPEKGDYTKIVYDIAEGQYKGYYSDDWGQKNTFAHTYYASYSDSNLGRYKGFLKAIDESNGTNFEAKGEQGFDEKLLVGKTIGIVIGYEEYENNRGEIKESAKAAFVCSVDRIRKGDFKIPELKKLAGSTKPAPDAVPTGFSPLGDEDLPF